MQQKGLYFNISTTSTLLGTHGEVSEKNQSNHIKSYCGGLHLMIVQFVIVLWRDSIYVKSPNEM
jgi:hypothetical protein